ncbi:gamma-glutamylcyclotransferase [Halomonas daqingensis]|uniref:Gamma-glutamylcyclotransferase n=1 Tax=Billgrantia desiderata TaxID=52021 RepID=A0ABS9B8P2_9GAMM|nr:gamma-glutamylcyclotransferase [Halomonas desiderata]MCE8048001.1 gamma-glutamylcyclotransferase [Halomonas desiderata]
MLCFSYGSNMSLARLRQRVPSAQFVAVATLSGHRLRFHKISTDGSGKCDAEATKDPSDLVYGVVIELAACQKPALDKKEGLGRGYDEKEVEIVSVDGETMRPTMYFATNIDGTRKPYHWYKKHVLIGAKENHLPKEYIESIEIVESVADPNAERSARELAIYR